jgi:histidyl-tRNA synthetase
LPDQDRPNEGVFSFQDDDEQWLSLRYDLTAPLARYVAENFDALPKPYRSYREGFVFRNEKPGPGRFRQFMQFDADTVGSSSPAADAEICMMAADTLEALGIPRGDYVIKVNNRKVLDGVMESIGLAGEENAGKRLTVLRAIDKLDRLGVDGVRQLLGPGRKDESGDFTKGAGLSPSEMEDITRYVEGATSNRKEFKSRIETIIDASSEGPEKLRAILRAAKSETREIDAHPLLAEEQINILLSVMGPSLQSILSDVRYIDDDAIANIHVRETLFEVPLTNATTLALLRGADVQSELYRRGLDELEQISISSRAAGYGTKRISVDPSVVRGLEYYTGPVFEAELTFPIPGEDGKPVRFGSVGGGGRYDGLIGRFRAEPVPATGFSIGVSRLQAALSALGKLDGEAQTGPVVVTVFDRDRVADYQRMVQRLRAADIRAELYLGSGRMGPQMKYADKRNAPCVIIQGGDEKARGEVQIKDLVEGAKAAAAIASNQEWRAARPAQFAVPEDKLVEAVREVLARHQ